jgi:hypothetical protein
MVLLGPFAIQNGLIGECFNSTLSSFLATAPPCGFTWSKPGAGDYIIDFGFEVDDRFFSVTGTPFNGSSLFYNVCTQAVAGGVSGTCKHSLTPTQVEVTVSERYSAVDSTLYLMVY